jgi:aryl-alcohol dehydrogenase-like predicted oxidoreductase
MDYRALGDSDLKVSVICLGTMTFGQQNTEAEAHAQLDYALSRGVNFIDAAEMYPVPPRAETAHRTETYIGTWLRKQARDRVIVATKVAGPSRGLTWIRGGPVLNRKHITEAIEGSLKRLQSDYIDLYQLHWPERNVPMFGGYAFDPNAEHAATPILEQLETLSDLVRAGKIRYVGLSNEHPWGVLEFLRVAREHNLPRIVSTQNAYNLLNRVYDYGLAEVCFREQVSLLAYSPLAFGHLSGKYLLNPSASGRITLFAGFGQRYSKPNVVPAVKAYIEVAQRYGLTPTQLALGWMVQRWCVASTIIGATTPAQLRENIDAWNVKLPAQAVADIDTVHLRYTNPAP